jgi:hypothetical protein
MASDERRDRSQSARRHMQKRGRLHKFTPKWPSLQPCCAGWLRCGHAIAAGIRPFQGVSLGWTTCSCQQPWSVGLIVALVLTVDYHSSVRKLVGRKGTGVWSAARRLAVSTFLASAEDHPCRLF